MVTSSGWQGTGRTDLVCVLDIASARPVLDTEFCWTKFWVVCLTPVTVFQFAAQV